MSSLLDQLTEIHDQQQEDRKRAWDKWMRKRSKHAGSANGNGTGVAQVDGAWAGDMIGISQMGMQKDNEDWKGFMKLVRRGVPLAYRAKVWAGEHRNF